MKIDKACGLDPGYEEYPFVYFTTPFANYSYRTTCVKECPTKAIKNPFEYKLACKTNSIVQNCNFTYEDGKLNESLLIYDTIPCNLKIYKLFKYFFKNKH